MGNTLYSSSETIQGGDLLGRTKSRCAHCGRIFLSDETIYAAHISPKDKGGDVQENMVPLCVRCERQCRDFYAYRTGDLNAEFPHLTKKAFIESTELLEKILGVKLPRPE